MIPSAHCQTSVLSICGPTANGQVVASMQRIALHYIHLTWLTFVPGLLVRCGDAFTSYEILASCCMLTTMGHNVKCARSFDLVEISDSESNYQKGREHTT